MRDMTCRGKRVDNAEWVYGYYVFQQKRAGAGGQTVTEFDHDRHLICGARMGEFWKVDPSTVGRFTGLYDSKPTKEHPKGQPIYEGDVVKQYYEDVTTYSEFDTGYHEESSGYFVGEVYYPPIDRISIRRCLNYVRDDEGKYQLDPKYISPKRLYPKKCEVIGNIHEHPDLLGGEKRG